MEKIKTDLQEESINEKQNNVGSKELIKKILKKSSGSRFAKEVEKKTNKKIEALDHSEKEAEIINNSSETEKPEENKEQENKEEVTVEKQEEYNTEENKEEAVEENKEEKSLEESLRKIEEDRRLSELEKSTFKGKIIKAMDKWENFGKEEGTKGFIKRMTKNAINLALVGAISSVSVEQMAEAGIGSATALGGGAFSYIGRKMAVGLGMMTLFEGVNKKINNNKLKNALSWTVGLGGIALATCTGGGAAVGVASAIGLISSKFIKDKFTSEKIQIREELAKENFFDKYSKETLDEEKLKKIEGEYQKLLKKYENQRIWGRIVDGARKLTISSVVSTMSLEAMGAVRDAQNTETNSVPEKQTEVVDQQKETPIQENTTENKTEVVDSEKEAPVTEKQAEIIDQQKETPIQENTTENQNTGISPTKEETVVTENKTEDSIEAVADKGQGAISTIRELQDKLKGEYKDSQNIPENIKHILETDPHKLAQEYGMYTPEEELESAKLFEGDKIIFNKETGSVVLDRENGTDINLSSGEKFDGEMFDANKNENPLENQNEDNNTNNEDNNNQENNNVGNEPKDNTKEDISDKERAYNKDGSARIEKIERDTEENNEGNQNNNGVGNKENNTANTTDNKKEDSLANEQKNNSIDKQNASMVLDSKEIKNLPQEEIDKLLKAGLIEDKTKSWLFGIVKSRQYEWVGSDEIKNISDKAESLGIDNDPKQNESVEDYKNRINEDIKQKEAEILNRETLANTKIVDNIKKDFSEKYKSDDSTYRVVKEYTSKSQSLSYNQALESARKELLNLNNGKTENFLVTETIKEFKTIRNTDGSYTTIIAAEAKKL